MDGNLGFFSSSILYRRHQKQSAILFLKQTNPTSRKKKIYYCFQIKCCKTDIFCHENTSAVLHLTEMKSIESANQQTFSMQWHNVPGFLISPSAGWLKLYKAASVSHMKEESFQKKKKKRKKYIYNIIYI